MKTQIIKGMKYDVCPVQFKMNKRVLNQVKGSEYAARRSEIKKVFLAPEKTSVPVKYGMNYHVTGYTQDGRHTGGRYPCVKIGCCHFYGDNFTRLRKWALSK